MPKQLLSISALLFAIFADNSFGQPPAKAEKIRHFSQPVQTDDRELARAFETAPRLTGVDIISGITAIGAIANTAYAAWTIIKGNQASVSANTTYANAVPKGVDPFEMEGFSEMQFKSYRLYGKNVLGSTVYDVTYTLAHRYGGTYDGKGNYLENVTIIPRTIKATFGYSVDMDVKKAKAINRGTKADPLAELTLDLVVKVSTFLHSELVTKSFEFHGDSAEVKELKIPDAGRKVSSR